MGNTLMLRYIIIAFLFFAISSCKNSQLQNLSQKDQLSSSTVGNDSVQYIALRPQYKKGKVHQFFFGEKYRDLWAMPVKVKPIHFEDEGLSILKQGGGRQSINLRLMDEEGNQFVLRSIDKNPVSKVSSIYQNSFLGSLAKDQTSSNHPYGPLTLPYMSDVLNIYHTNPQLRYIPDDTFLLGKYYEDFAGMMVMMEHRPDDDQSQFSYLGNSKNVVSTHNFLDDMLKENDSKLDQHHYLKTRMFDMLIGDWSRHEDNWRWATYEQEKSTFYKAIPRDRDHVYFYLDGIVPRFFRSIFKPHFQSFKKDFENIVSLNSSAESLDKLLLWSLEKEAWIKLADSVSTLLTDNVIDKSLTALPAEVYKENGAWLAEILKARREKLSEEIEKYYLYLAKNPTVYGTDKHEKFVCTVVEENLLLEIYKIDKNGEERKLLHRRLFLSSETREIKLFGLGGNDHFIFNGKGSTKIKLEIYGGSGEDSYVQESAHKLVKAKVVDTEAGSSLTLKKGISFQKEDDPNVLYFDANGTLLQYYIWD